MQQFSMHEYGTLQQQNRDFLSLLRATKKTSNLHYYAKRILDIVMVIVSLILLLPLFLLIGLLIKFDSPGPIFFVQERVGSRRRSYHGETVWEIHNFRFCKFRSMFHNVDQSIHQAHIKAFVQGTLASSENSDAQFKLANDPRITRVGRILRRTSLDELPQLLNILRGEMSLVGPRPVPPYEVGEYQPWHYERLTALPGMTGLWQVNGRGRVTFEEMMKMDIEYVRNQSMWFDIKLLFLTIPAALFGWGAE
jgi:lipopolysaccharide/colanic/teichoic acid biosynthesis glycosyltransferase